MSLTISRRFLLALPLAIAAVQPSTMTAQTPVSTPVTDQLVQYQTASDALLATGRASVAALLEGNDADFSVAMAHPDLAALSASTELDWLQTNRIRLRWTDPPLLIDGHFDGSGTMAGLAWQTGGPTTIVLTADSDQAQTVPMGRWTGVLGPGPSDLPVVVTFEGDEKALSALLDVPGQDLTSIPASSAAFFTELLVGDLIQDAALPLGPANLSYRAEYVWGDALLGIELAASPDQRIVGFDAVLREILPPDRALHLEPAVTFQLPASGPLLVAWGGPTEFQNYHAATPAQRHALDLLAWANGATYQRDGLTNADYFIWGADVLAPANGTVVTVLNDQPDTDPLLSHALTTVSANPDADRPPAHPAGNHVVLEAAQGAYVILAHLQQGSIVVNVGDVVTAGDRLGLVGNSGNTSEPHLHLHAQTSPDLLDPTAIGLPLTFTSYLANGQRVASGSPVQGQFVEQP